MRTSVLFQFSSVFASSGQNRPHTIEKLNFCTLYFTSFSVVFGIFLQRLMLNSFYSSYFFQPFSYFKTVKAEDLSEKYELARL